LIWCETTGLKLRQQETAGVILKQEWQYNRVELAGMLALPVGSEREDATG
jgi:hypothetical protein